MKFQSFLNVSNKDDIQADSGFVFQRLLAPELIRRGHQFCLTGPVPLDIDGASHEYCDLGSNKLEVRFKFDWDEISKMIERQQPDVLWINQPELAAGFRSILCSLGSDAQLLTYIHYLPIHQVAEGKVEVDPSLNNGQLGLPILLAVLGSLNVSDKVLVQSQFALQTLLQALEAFRIPYDEKKLHLLPPPFDPYMMANGENGKPPEKSILYNHRLYKHYGTEFFLEVIRMMEDRKDVRFMVADLLASRNGSRKKLGQGYVEYYRSILSSSPNVSFANNKTRAEYKQAIDRCRIGLAAHRKMAVWSMSAVDCLGMGVPVIAPNFASYPEFVPANLLYNSIDEFKEIANTLLESDKSWTLASEDSKSKIRSFSPSSITDRLLKVVE